MMGNNCVFKKYSKSQYKRAWHQQAGTACAQIEGGVVSSMTSRGYTNGYEYYGTFSRALFTLFQVLTGESWAEMVARPLLFGKPEWDSSWSVFGVATFFTTFILLHQIVLVNVVVAVLLDK